MELKKLRELRRINNLPGFEGGTPWDTYAKPPYNPTSPWLSSTNITAATPYLPGYGYVDDGYITGGYNPTSFINTSNIDPKIIPPSGVVEARDMPITIKPTDSAGKKPLPVSVSQAGNIATSAIGFLGATMNAYSPVKGQSELISDGGYSIGNVGGFDYQRLNGPNYKREMDELSRQNTSNTLGTMGTGAALGASVGSIIPGLGTVVGGAIGAVGGAIAGIFGGASRKKRLERKMIAANQLVNRTNTYSKSAAHSDFMQQDYGYNHATTLDDILYGAKGGKDMFSLLPGYVEGFDVYTSDGIKNGKANSRVAFGESIFNANKGTATIVKTGKLDQDTNLADLEPSDIVYGNHLDKELKRLYGIDISFRDEALPFAAVLEKINKRR